MPTATDFATLTASEVRFLKRCDRFSFLHTGGISWINATVDGQVGRERMIVQATFDNHDSTDPIDFVALEMSVRCSSTAIRWSGKVRTFIDALKAGDRISLYWIRNADGGSLTVSGLAMDALDVMIQRETDRSAKYLQFRIAEKIDRRSAATRMIAID